MGMSCILDRGLHLPSWMCLRVLYPLGKRVNAPMWEEALPSRNNEDPCLEYQGAQQSPEAKGGKEDG
jgi:hypothetical protein